MKKTVATLVILLLLCISAIFLVLGNATLHASEIVYDGTTIRWNSVPFADYYTVSIDGGEPIVCEDTEYHYPNGGDFSVVVTVHKNIFANDAQDKNFRYLQKADGLQFKDGVFYWNPVFDAESYSIEINGKVVDTVSACSYAYDGTQDAVFRVKANSSNPVYYSVWSEPYSAYILPSPQNVFYNRETNTITWDSVPYARFYTVWVDGRYFVTDETSYVYHAGTTSFTLQLQANGAKEERIFDSSRSQPQPYSYLKAVSNLRIQDGVLTWDAVTGATAYRIRVDGEEVPAVAENRYTDLTPNRAYTVQVLPKNENPYAYSDWQTITFTVLDTPVLKKPTEQANENVLLAWDPIAGAQTYTLRIYRDGELFSTQNLTECSYATAFAQTGVYTVTVQCDATAQFAQSAPSQTATVIRLPAVSSHTVDDKGTVRFEAVSGASSYTVKIGNSVVISSLTDTTFALTDGIIARNGEIFEVSIIPNGTDDGNTLLLDGTDVYSFLVKKAPRVNGVTVSETGVRWSLSASADAYRVTVVLNDGEPIVRDLDASVSSLDLSFLQAGTYRISVQALCFDPLAKCIPSDSAKDKDVVRLAQPSVTLQKDNETLYWEKVDRATEYHIYVDGNKLTRPVYGTSPSFALSSYVTANERTIAVRAHSTKTDCLYLTSISSEVIPFCRLGTPASVKVDNEKITWSAVAGADYYEIYIKADGSAQEEKFTAIGTSYNHSSAIGVGKHTVVVKAFSLAEKYLPARRSSAVTVLRLPTPKINVVRGGSELSWSLPTSSSVPSGFVWDYISISCNGQETRLEKTKTKYKPQNIVFGTYGDTSHQYFIQLQFVGSGDATIGHSGTISSFVDEYSFTAMKAPTPSVYANHRGGGKFSVGASFSNLPSNTTVRLECNGAVETPSVGSLTYLFQLDPEVATAAVRAQIIGGFFDNGIYYGDSDWSDYQYANR